MEKGQRALEEIKSGNGGLLKGTISVVQIDVTDEKSIQTVKENIEAQFGKLDVLINNAGKGFTLKSTYVRDRLLR